MNSRIKYFRFYKNSPIRSFSFIFTWDSDEKTRLSNESVFVDVRVFEAGGIYHTLFN